MRYSFLFSTLLILASCGSAMKETKSTSTNIKIDYPAEIVKIFDHHGGLAKWKTMNALSYEIVKDKGNEKQFIDLKNRREKIEGGNFTSGYNGKEYWVEADTSYKGNVKFYTNLMFYFYAMPFVLADDGITYSKTEPIIYEGKSYPGLRISYGEGVGISPEDEYYIHYDADTNQMAWLGYTVTFKTGKKSDKVKYIRYDDWKTFNGLLLPNSITWFTVEDGKPLAPRSTRNFVDVVVAERPMDDATFAKPADATVVE